MGFKRNTNMVIDLISEGEVRLVNGLASIYLNKTPIANSASQHDILSKKFDGSVSGTALTFTHGGIYKNDTYRPIRIQKAGKVGTVTGTAGSADVVASSGFFTSSMIASSTPAGGGLYQYIRIPGAGPGGSEYVGEVTAVASGTNATLYPALSTSVSGVEITFDHFSHGLITGSGATLDVTSPRSGSFAVDVGGMSLELGKPDASALNYKFVRASFRSGTLHQPPLKNMPGFTSASFGRTLGNTELKQHSDYYGLKLVNGRDTAIDYATSGSTIEIASGTDLPVTADRILITITTPSLEAFKASSGAKSPLGLTLQIWFDYKTGAGDWAEELIFGPTDAQLAASKSYVWSAANNPLGAGTTGDIKGHDTESQDHEFSFNIDQFKPFTQFRIRIKRVTPVAYKLGAFEYSNSTFMKSVQGFIEDKLSYPYSAYAAIMYDSNEFEGNTATRAYHCYGIPCWVPTNYITRLESNTGIAKYTRNSSGVDTGSYVPWDGTFRKIYCDNPAWVLRTLLLENRFGLGNWLKAEHIGSYSFYSMARRCDELVPDGEGGMEPRFVCGVYLTQATEAYKIIKDFCSIMLSVPYWIDGQLSLEGDRPQEPIYTFSKGNIIGGIFNYEGTGNKTRPNQIAVTFNDKNNFYTPTVELVDDVEDMINKNRIYSEEAVAFGAVTRSQAIRYAKWKLLTSRMNREIISFKTSENAGYLKPGNVIRVQDADRYRVRYSGRIVSATTTSVTIDKPITISTGTYKLHVMVPGPATYLSQDSAVIDTITYSKGDQLPIYTEQEAQDLVDDSGNQVEVTWSPDMHLETRTVTTSPGSGITTLAVSAAFSSAPESDFIWAFTHELNTLTVEGSSKLYRVLGIAEESIGVYAIAAAEHYNEKFDLLDETYIAEVSELVSNLDEIPQISNFRASVVSRNSGVVQDSSGETRVALDVVLRWTPPKVTNVNSTTSVYPDLSRYLIQYYTILGELKNISVSKTATSYTVENLPPGSYEFNIQAFNVAGATTTPIYTTVVVRNDAEVAGTVNQVGIPRGGHFTVAPFMEGNKIKTSDDYKFTSPSGTTVEIAGGNIV